MNAAQRTAAVRTTLLACIVIMVINLASLVLDHRDRAFRPLMIVDVCHALLAAGVAIVVARARKPWSTLACDIAFAVVTAPFLVGIWLPQIYDLRGGHLVEPMLAHHFLLLGIAVAAPTWRSGGAMIALFTGHALVLEQVLSHGQATPALDHEPWFTLFFALIAGVLLSTRARRRELEKRLAAAESRTHTLAQVSRMLLALRDRANTPLQTLEVAIALLEQREVHDAAQLALMRRALADLIAIQQALAASDARPADLGTSLDLDVALRELLHD